MGTYSFNPLEKRDVPTPQRLWGGLLGIPSKANDYMRTWTPNLTETSLCFCSESNSGSLLQQPSILDTEQAISSVKGA
jgi:hypothetical protein